MIKKLRLNDIESTIIKKGIVTLKELSRSYNVSMNTIRSDIDDIIKGGKVRKVYGGVESIVKVSDLLDYEIREDKKKSEKEKICQTASTFIEEDDLIFIDSGTTTIYLSKFLKTKKITVITNNIIVINQLSNYKNIRLVSLGGVLHRKTKSFVGELSLLVLNNYNIKKAFLSATAVSLKSGAMNSSSAENNIKRLVASKAEEKYVLVDSSKFEKQALLTYMDIKDVDAIITGKCDESLENMYMRNGIKIIK